MARTPAGARGAGRPVKLRRRACESSRVSERGGARAGRGVSARGARRGRRCGARAPRGRPSGGFDPGAGRDAGDVPRAGKGRRGWRGRVGRARGCGRHALAGVSRGGLPGGLAKSGSLPVAGGPLGRERSRSRRKAEARGGACRRGVRPRSLRVPAGVQDLRDGVTVIPPGNPGRGAPPFHPSSQSPACVAIFDRRLRLSKRKRGE